MTKSRRPKPRLPTFSGADKSLAQSHGAVFMGEVAFLFTWYPEDRNRYPARKELARWIRELNAISWQEVALHVCGSRAREALLAYQLADLTNGVERIQVNGEVTREELREICALYRSHMIITQHNEANKALVDAPYPNHALLVDASGGRGKVPSKWEAPVTDKPVGFAGGLGPENLERELPRIEAVAKDGYWIDMESSLRNEHDLFDKAKAVEASRLFFQFCNQ